MSNKTKLTGDNYPHTDKMSLSEWKAFRSNFKSDLSCKNYLINNRHSTFTNFIMGCFSWGETKQGGKYWSKIYGRDL